MRRQFVLDKRINHLLEELAADRGGNRSQVVREAIQVYADIEATLGEVEANPKFRQMMAGSAEDIRAGRVLSQKEVKKRAAGKNRSR